MYDFSVLTFCHLQTQRRQQKQSAKLTLDLLTSEDASTDVPPLSTNEQQKAETESPAEEPISQSEPTEQNQETPADEEMEDDEEGAQNSSNKFISLSEEGTGNLEVEEEDGHKEVELSKSMRALSVSEDQQSKEVESEMELGAESGFVVVNADPKAAFSTLSSREALNISESSVESSLHQFTQVEQLTHTNSLLCLTCSRKASQGTHTHPHTHKRLIMSLSVSFFPLSVCVCVFHRR